MIIEAGYGLGEAIVSGQITPMLCDWQENFDLLDINVSEQSRALRQARGGECVENFTKVQGSKQKLTGKQILELAKICVNIENIINFLVILNGRFKSKFYITQSRPITTL